MARIMSKGMINQLISERNLALKLAMFGFPLRIFVCAFLHSKIVEGIDVEPAQLDLAFLATRPDTLVTYSSHQNSAQQCK